jgi:hypothetical protein
MTAGFSILAVVTCVGLKLASHPETSAALKDISLVQHSEHSYSSPTPTFAGFRIRLSPSDFGYEVLATDREVPQISLAAQ